MSQELVELAPGLQVRWVEQLPETTRASVKVDWDLVVGYAMSRPGTWLEVTSDLASFQPSRTANQLRRRHSLETMVRNRTLYLRWPLHEEESA